MSQSTITFLILAATIAVFVWDRLPVAVVALGVALSLWASGVLELEQSLGGFGDPTVIFIASLFVVSEGLDSSGVTAWIGQGLIAGAGASRTRLIVLMMGLVAVLTALISVNGSVAALLPVVAVMAVRLRMSPGSSGCPSSRCSAWSPSCSSRRSDPSDALPLGSVLFRTGTVRRYRCANDDGRRCWTSIHSARCA
jgi:di/tricarboxylate transporter